MKGERNTGSKFITTGEFQWCGVFIHGGQWWMERKWRAICMHVTSTIFPFSHDEIQEPWPMIMRPRDPNIHKCNRTLPKICEQTVMIKAKTEHQFLRSHWLTHRFLPVVCLVNERRAFCAILEIPHNEQAALILSLEFQKFSIRSFIPLDYNYFFMELNFC